MVLPISPLVGEMLERQSLDSEEVWGARSKTDRQLSDLFSAAWPEGDLLCMQLQLAW